MTKDNLLKAVSCNVKPEILTKIIASMMHKDPANCFRQLILCFLYLSYDVNGFDVAIREVAKVWKEKKDLSTNADYFSKLLSGCRSDATMACKKLAIARNSNLDKCEPLEICDELTTIDDPLIVDMLADLLMKIDDDENVSKENALRRAIDVDLSNKENRLKFKEILEESRIPQHKVLVEDCFYLMEDFPDLINDILFVLCHTICYPKQNRIKRLSIEKIEGALFQGSLTLACGWTPPSSLMRFKNTCVYFEKTNVPVISSDDENMAKTFENMVKTAELCQDSNSEDQMADFSSNENKTPKKPSGKTSKPVVNKSMNDIYDEVWQKLSLEERKPFGHKLHFKKEMKQLPGEYPTENSKYSELAQFFDCVETITKNPTASSSDPKKRPNKTDSIREISVDNVGELVAELTRLTSPFAYINITEEDGTENTYVGKMSASPPNEKYHAFFNWVKTLFGIKADEHVLFKCAKKHCVVKSGTKPVVKTIGIAKSEDPTKKDTFSIWQCYLANKYEPALLKMETFVSDKSSDTLRKNAIKFAIVRWLFGYTGTSFDNLYYLCGDGVTGFWDNAPADKGESGCLSNLLKNETMIQIITEFSPGVVKEVSKILEKNIEDIYNYFPEEKDRKKIRTLLETKLRPSMINTDDTRSYEELILDEIMKEVAVATKKVEEDKAKKMNKAK